MPQSDVRSGDYVRILPNAAVIPRAYLGEVVRIVGTSRDGRTPTGHYYRVRVHDGVQLYLLPDEILSATEEDFLIDRLAR